MEGEAYVITNTYAPNKTSIQVTKKWIDEDNLEGSRPGSIQVRVLAKPHDGDNLDNLNLNEDGYFLLAEAPLKADVENWSHTFDIETKYLKELSFEEAVPEGYQESCSGSIKKGFTITWTSITV